MDHEDSAILISLSGRGSVLYNRREERNLLPGCFLTSEACSTLILLDLVRQLHFCSPLSLVRSDPDGCPPAWKEGVGHRSSSTDRHGPRSCGLYLAPWCTWGCPESPPQGVQQLFAFLHLTWAKGQAERCTWIPTQLAWADGWDTATRLIVTVVV